MDVSNRHIYIWLLKWENYRKASYEKIHKVWETIQLDSWQWLYEHNNEHPCAVQLFVLFW